MGGPSFDLSGRVALVTGGGTGLGKGIALGLAGAGAFTVVAGRRKAPLGATVAEMARAGGKGAWLAGDVSSADEARRLVDAVRSRHGRLDVLVNGAGINRRGPMLEFSERDWDEVMATNLKGLFFCSQAAARVMKDQGGGKIIHIVSLTSERGLPNVAPYGASKAAVAQLTKSMAVEWAPHKITVNAIGPGWFRTEMTDALFQNQEWHDRILARHPLGRFGVPEDLAGAAVFLASPAADYVTGQAIYVDGGYLTL
ncbi:MAG TPA: glucose 1-dehydrogenase [Candidatus Sulfotelmatobacter sp.]|nr:glucose 1-dehydrogenase [Candidatus Sulfotelmatobacter sp.]